MKRTLIALATALLVLAPLAPAHADRPTEAARTTYHPSWHKVHFHMNAYQGAGVATRCEGSYRDDVGHCFGQGESGLSAPSHPFDQKVSWWWWRQRPGACTNPFPGGHRNRDAWPQAVEIMAGGRVASFLCGWMDPHWGTYVVTGGQVPADGALRPVHASNADVGQREHRQGGPMFVHLRHHGNGYVLGLRGWLFY